MTKATMDGFINKPEDRFEAVSAVLAAAGATLKEYYFTTGENDWLLIFEVDSADAFAAAALVAGADDAATHMKTVQAWTSGEFKAVASKASEIREKYRTPGS
jgi:uncharacterized protein with GYD domain